MPPELRRIPVAGSVPAEHAGFLVAGDERPFAIVGKWAGSAAIVGSEPLRSGKCPALPSHTDGQAGHSAKEGVGGGWFGVLGFPLGREIERIGDPPPRPVPSPP